MSFHEELVHLAFVVVTFELEVRKCLLKKTVPGVFFIFQDSPDGRCRPMPMPACGYLLFIEFPRKLVAALAGKRPLEEISHPFCLLFHNGNDSVTRVVTVGDITQLECTVFKAVPDAPFFVFGNGHGLALGKTAHEKGDLPQEVARCIQIIVYDCVSVSV